MIRPVTPQRFYYETIKARPSTHAYWSSVGFNTCATIRFSACTAHQLGFAIVGAESCPDFTATLISLFAYCAYGAANAHGSSYIASLGRATPDQNNFDGAAAAGAPRGDGGPAAVATQRDREPTLRNVPSSRRAIGPPNN